MKAYDSFALFETRESGILFPKDNHGIIVLAEKMKSAFPILGTLNFGNRVKTLLAPASLNNIKLNPNDVKSSLGSTKYDVIQNVKGINNSFVFDSTVYINDIFKNSNPTSYVGKCNKFYSMVTNVLDQEIPEDINNWSMVYVFDDILLQNKITPSELYFWFFLKQAADNDGESDVFPFDDVFFWWKHNGENTVIKIYERETPINFNKIKFLLLNIKPNFMEQTISNDKDKSDKKSYLDKILSLLPSSYKVPKIDGEKKDDNSEVSIKEIEPPETPPITKPDVAANNINNFSFLLSKRSPSQQSSAINIDDINSVAKFIALKNGQDKSREWILSNFEKIKSTFLSHNKQATEAVSMFKNKDYEALSVYVNTAVEEYTSNIYPIKPTIQKEVLDKLDSWSDERGYSKPQQIDPVLTSKIIDTHIRSNLHRAMAQKEITWQEMPQQIEEMITPVLADSGFKFLSISMVDAKPDPKQVEPTYMTDIKIKIQNMKTRKIQTVKFMIPTLLEGKYHISGGIKWLFPNILATLPIFVIDPGKVQFKTNYSAITFEHNVTSKKETVTVLVGGIKMPILVWMLQLKSFDEICELYGIEYSIITSRKGIDPNSKTVKLPDKKLMVLKVTSDNTQKKIANALIYDLQPLINKVGIFDLTKPDDNSDLIIKLTGRKSASYSFRKIKKYMIDMRIATILKQRHILPDLFEVTKLCTKFSITNTEEDKLGINNVYLRLMDLVPAEIERAFHYSLTEYRRRSTIDPDTQLLVNEGWVINALREQSVLLLYKDGNPTVETAQFTAARLVGPGGFSKTDTVQVKDRRIPPSHFGVLDPIDTAEGAPGVQIYMSSGFEYDPDHKTFNEPEKNDNYTNMFSSSASMIPFINHNDGNRAQFGCSQTRQVVPVINAEVPLVGTGMEAYIPAYSSTKFVKKAKRNGEVVYIDKKIIILRYDDGSYDKIDIRTDSLQTGIGKANALTHTPLVKVGDKVKPFQHLTSNPFIKNAYSSGVNVLAAFKTEEGYSYEDGVVVSETFAKKCTSTHYNSIDLSLESLSELKIFPLQRFKETGEMKYNEGEIIVKTSTATLGGFQEAAVVAPSQCEVVDIQIYPAKPEFNELVKEVDRLLNGNSNSALRKCGLSSMTNVNDITDNVGKFKFRKDELTRTFIRIKVVEYRICGLGDKLNNRHGNKGVITRVIPDNMMPVLPDGRSVDICLNPLGVVSRMNLGQVFEIHVGNILDTARRNLQKMNDEDARTMLCKLYTILDGSKDKKLSQNIVLNLKEMSSSELHTTVEYLKNNGIRMIFPAYDNLSIEEINEAAKLVGTELKSRLYQPKYKRKTINECAWGILFVNKLEHISALKQNTRSVGPYLQTTLSPSKPGNHRNAIRISELDTWCILAYNANTVLKELFVVNGNNQKAKLKIIGDIENTGSGSLSVAEDYYTSGSDVAFKVYTTAAGLKI